VNKRLIRFFHFKRRKFRCYKNLDVMKIFRCFYSFLLNLELNLELKFNILNLVSNVLLGFFNSSQSVVLLQVVGVQLNRSFSQSLLFPLVWAQVA
jgi:hypothetical protein